MSEPPQVLGVRGLKCWFALIALLAAGVRFGFFSFLHHQYMQSGVTAWHGILALVPGVGYFLSVFLFRWPDPRYYYPWLISPLLVVSTTVGIIIDKVSLRICQRKI